MLKVVIAYDASEQPWSHEWKRALKRGIEACGDHARLTPAMQVRAHEADATVTWGLRGGRRGIMETSIARGKHHLIMERGFIGDRTKWTALSFDGIAGRGLVPPAPTDDGARLRQYFSGALQDWKAPRVAYKNTALLIGQIKGDATTRHVNLELWLEQTAAALLAANYRVVYRPHPLERAHNKLRTPPGVILGGQRPLLEEASESNIVVTYNSTSGVDTVLAGYRTFAQDIGSPAYAVAELSLPLANRDSSDYVPEPIGRAEWAAALAWRQWSMQDISTGFAWSHVRKAVL